MKVLIYNEETEPAAQIQCDCGEIFWVDPCGEENLIAMKIQETFPQVQLVEQCPKCLKTNADKSLKYPVIG
jgi:hypothetical protein